MVGRPCYQVKIGMLIPATNLVMEEEFHMMASGCVDVFTTRVLHKGRKESDTSYELVKRLAADVPDAVTRVRQVKPDVVLFGCTAGSFVEGRWWNEQITNVMESKVGVPAITTSTAVTQALDIMGMQSIGLGSPYSAEVNGKLVSFLGESGIHVSRVQSISHQQAQEKDTAYELTRLLNGADIDGVFLSCTDFWTIHALNQLEREVEKPVISSNQASFWACLRLGRFAGSIEGFGSLLRHEYSIEEQR